MMIEAGVMFMAGSFFGFYVAAVMMRELDRLGSHKPRPVDPKRNTDWVEAEIININDKERRH